MNPITSLPVVPPSPARPAPQPAAAPVPVPPVSTPPAPVPPAPNPGLRIEPELGLVVFEVRDASGEVVRSMPTERELRAYRTAALRGDAPAPSDE